MATLVHLGSDDGLLEASSRTAKATGDGEVVLVVPEGAPVLANALFLRALREVVPDRALVLVTADLRARSLASGAHIPAYASLTAYEQRAVDATDQLEKARIAAIAEIARERRRRRAIQRRVLVAVAIALLLTLAFVPSAEVTVAGEEATVTPIELDVAATTSGSIQATAFSTKLSASVDAAAGGSRQDRSKATGVERFVNASTDAIDIPVGTLVWTSSNMRFQTTQAKRLAPSTLFPFFASEVVISIEAVEPGPAGNVGRGSITNVADRRVRVTNEQPTSGGAEKKVPVIVAADYAAASAKLDQAIDAAIRAQLAAWAASLSDERRLEEHYATEAVSRTASGDVVGKELDTFKVAASIQLTAFAVPIAEPNATAVRELTRLLPAEHELVPESLKIEVPSVRLAANGVTWHVKASARHRPRVDEGVLQLALAGQDRATAAKLLEPRGMKLVELRASPSWWPRLPLLPLRIDVRSVGS